MIAKWTIVALGGCVLSIIAGCTSVAYGHRMGLVVRDAATDQPVPDASLVSITGDRRDVLDTSSDRGYMLVKLVAFWNDAPVWIDRPVELSGTGEDWRSTSVPDSTAAARRIYWDQNRSALVIEAPGYYRHVLSKVEREEIMQPNYATEPAFLLTAPVIRLRPLNSTPENEHEH